MYVPTSLHFRDTLTFLTEAFCQSTLPFVWDDPTSIADLKQVSVDLANGAARGKSGGHQVPKNSMSCDCQLRHSRVEKSETTSRNSDNYFKHKE